MKRLHILTLICFCIFTTAALAQRTEENRQERMERIESAKVAFLTDKMALTPDQSQKFWPVYNEFDAKRKELRKKGRSFREKDFANLSDKEVRQALDEAFDLRQKELNLEKEYMNKFLKVISVRQLASMYQAEREFTKVLLRRLNQEHRGQH